MKSLRDLLKAVLLDVEQLSGTSTSRDIDYCLKRLEDEGFSFLAITLGNFCDDFERSLDRGYIASSDFHGFRKGRKSLPAFLQGLTTLIFDSDGTLLLEPCEQSIRYVRQICRMWKKLEVPCSKERVTSAFQGYLAVEKELGTWTLDTIPADLYDTFGKVSDLLVSTLDFIPGLPRHGNGAVADRKKMSEKYSTYYWYSRCTSFSMDDTLFKSANHWLDRKSQTLVLSPEQEIPVRVTTVPKTLKGPRIIGMEPTLQQYLQQSVLQTLVPELESNIHFRGIRFTDQTRNAELAKVGSRNCLWATLDLKEASDRVHKDVVWRMLRSNSLLRGQVFDSRSATSVLPNGTECLLWKFASMGSALCFPIESMVFYAIVLSSIHMYHGTRPTRSSIIHYSADISIFGDDIIIPTDVVPRVVADLEFFKLKVNSTKSFWTGKFRESCGMDAYNGIDVTPVYVRSMCPRSRKEACSIVSWLSTSNQLFEAGYFRASMYMLEQCSKYAFIMEGDGTTCFLSHPWGRTPRTRWNPTLQRTEYFGTMDHVSQPKVKLDDWEGFSRWMELRSLSEHEVDNSKTPKGYASLALKTRWSVPITRNVVPRDPRKRILPYLYL